MTTPSQPSLEALAAGEIDAFDDQVLDHIRVVYDLVDPVPSGLVDRIQFGLTLDALHAEVAELQRSSQLVGVRAEDIAESETVTFTSPSITLMVKITKLSAEVVRVDGWAEPGGGVAIYVRTSTGTVSTEADADGRFAFAELPRGLVQFVVRRGDDPEGPPVITPSIVI